MDAFVRGVAMKIVAIRVGTCPACLRPVLDTQRHVVRWEGAEALYFHEACLSKAIASDDQAEVNQGIVPQAK